MSIHDSEIRLVYPEIRTVSAKYIMTRWEDALANGEVEPRDSKPTLAEAIFDLEDIGQITVGKAILPGSRTA